MNANLGPSDIIAIIISLLVGMTVHEAMHAYVGLKLGDRTAADQGRVSFNPLRHIDPLTTVLLPLVTLVFFGVPILAARPVPFNPGRVRFGEYGAALLAFAGPFSNLVLAFLAALVLHATSYDAVIINFLGWFIELNVVLFVFNLIPIPPLDGSRVLYAFAPEAVQDIMERLEPYGLFIVFGLVFLTGLSGALGTIENSIVNLLLNI